MGQHLVLSIHLHDRRYHGVDEWPPAPARVFQALVAGVARGRHLPPEARPALEWFEALPAPVIAAPPQRPGQRLSMFVPNNDADALDGDLTRIAEIRTKKMVRPRLLDGESPFVYAWPIEEDNEVARVEAAAEQIYQLGRGVDMAWANAEVLDEAALEERLAQHRGAVYRPAPEGASTLACPTTGSLASLLHRHGEAARRIRQNSETDDGTQLFSQPPKPRFVQVAYAAPTVRRVYELRRVDDESAMHPWPVSRAVALVERLRDGAADRLRRALPKEAAAIARSLIGRKPDGADAGPTAARVRILPLPSVGHEYADRAIRRVAVEVPPGGALAAGDVHWAFSGLETAHPNTGVVDPFVLTPADDERMLGHYTAVARHWRTVTPAALPEAAKRRRITPLRQREEAKSAAERTAEESQAINAVRIALRHGGVRAEAARIHVQREPFETKGSRAETFADGTRFTKERLWHVEIELAASVDGPLVLGDGRFLGLGVLAPVRTTPGIWTLGIESGLSGEADSFELARALRRAVMARVQAEIGRESLPAFFSGHAGDGRAARSEEAPHLAFQFDAPRRLLVIAPHRLERREPTPHEGAQLARLERALAGFGELRAGRAGKLALGPAFLDNDDCLVAASRTWLSRTPYQVERHRKAGSAHEALTLDVVAACRRRGLPTPLVTVPRVQALSGRGLEGELLLRFPVAVAGPLLLGRSRYLGGGLFAAVGKT